MVSWQFVPVYLETSTLKNMPWYKRMGFEVYDEVELSYTLFFLKLDLKYQQAKSPESNWKYIDIQ